MTTSSALCSLVLLIAILLIIGCGHTPVRNADAARKLGTLGRLNASFHSIVDDPEGLGFIFPGFLIGIEKSDRHLLDVPTCDKVHFAEGRLPADVERKRLKYLADPKRTFISHVVEAQLAEFDAETAQLPRFRNRFLYDAYGSRLLDGGAHGAGLYGASWTALDTLTERIKELFEVEEERRPTIILLYSMGWNTPQEEAIRNYNSLYGHLANAAGEAREHGSGVAFRPVFIGLSWPSTWNLPGVSYFNKARDADEIGFVWANYLLNSLLSLKADRGGRTYGVPVVLVGHSFGTRILSRALFSQAALTREPPATEVDLFVSLEGAFSINRFLPERRWGQEGAPYRDHADRHTMIVLTWSEQDKANPVANHVTSANNVGGLPGYRRASDRRYRDRFQFRAWNKNGILDHPLVLDGRLAMIDASQVIRFAAYDHGGRAHSDIYTPEVGRGLWQLVEQFASRPPVIASK